MERINQYQFYQVGRSLGRLMGYVGDEVRGNEIVFDLWRAQRGVDALVRGKPIPLGVSHGAIDALKGALDRIDDRYFKAEDEQGRRQVQIPGPDAAPIPEYELRGVSRALETFETVFGAEMADTATYFVPRRGIYFTPALVDHADESFPESLRPFIPEKAKNDWCSAGRCLAFSLLSASGFHVARAVEGTLERYYQIFTGNDGTLNGWNDYHQALKRVFESDRPDADKPREKTLVEFLQMKDDYRNPIMHPRVVLNENDGICQAKSGF